MRVVLSSHLDDELLLGRTLRSYVEELPVPEGAFVVLDALCPLVPAEFVAELVTRVVATGVAHAGVRPVTDTVKELDDGVVGGTVDRDSLRALASPVVLPGPVELPATLLGLVASLDEVVLVDAPAAARRVSDRSDIAVLEALVLDLR